MGSSEFTGYCSFNKAIEHLGDRWNLFILRELAMFGPQGFNDLATGLPGRISRSVLADRLRKLQNLGLVAHADALYRLTAAGTELVPTILSLRGWAETWLPDDPDMVERDPDVVLGWLARRVVPERLPERPVVLEFTTHHHREHRWWLVLQQGAEPYGCLRDPLLDENRYLYIQASVTTLLALARGRRDCVDMLADGLVISGPRTWRVGSPSGSHLPPWPGRGCPEGRDGRRLLASVQDRECEGVSWPGLRRAGPGAETRAGSKWATLGRVREGP